MKGIVSQEVDSLVTLLSVAMLCTLCFFLIKFFILWLIMRTPHRSYFNFIRIHFGSHAVNCMKSWIGCRRLIVKNYVHTRFIKQCILNDVTPRHLSVFDNFNISFRNSSSNKKFSNLKFSLIKRILRVELSDSHRAIDRYRDLLFHFVSCLSVFRRTSVTSSSGPKENRSIGISSKKGIGSIPNSGG